VETDRDDLALALELADIADSITRERFRAGDLSVETKPDLTPVTEADTAVEHACRDRLVAARPVDAIVGEEFGARAAVGSPRKWIIDPIDGTKNFVRGIPVWGTLIALHVEDQPTVGVASAPALGRRWWAVRGGGAFVADGSADEPRRMGVSAVGELHDAQLVLSGLNEWERQGRLEALLALIRSCWRTRGFGDFWGYMLVAEGSAEIMLDPVVAVWDVAAPQIIVEEAGGRFTDLGGNIRANGGSGAATNGLLHENVLRMLGA
jgi:histidinol-phosphatase